MTTAVLLTVDEARDRFGTSAIALVEAFAGTAAGAPRLLRLLGGRGNTRGLPDTVRRAVTDHRGVVRAVLASGHAWVLDDEIEGALSYFAGLPGFGALSSAA